MRPGPFLPLVPTQRAAWLIVGFAPVALLIASLYPQLWIVAPIAAVAVVVLIVLDGLLAGGCEEWQVVVPADTEVGQPTALDIHARFKGRLVTGPEGALEFDPRLAPTGRATIPLFSEPDTGAHSGSIDAFPSRRGTAEITRAWLRWSGPLGLGARQTRMVLEEQAVRIWPDLSPVRSKELQTFMRNATTGLIARRIRGEGTQFEALAEYQPGMDRRKIDWKASARHTHLYARENESERNNQIVFAFDCGQAMCEPVDGMARIDRAVTAALTCSYVALKGGDKVSLFGFAQRPQVMTPFVSDSRAFHRLQSAAASLDYDAVEPNFTLALATLTAKLQRRSLIVLFSDFTDPTAAEMMIESIGRLVDKHLVLFVTIADSELETFIDSEPDDIATIARSVTADTLQHQRQIVLQRLRRMGVDVIEAPYSQIGYQLIDRYFLIKGSEAIG
ncbi:DUF58 domain-containing protein [uncultured Erythrobacter sp.]|uniref:DUF58 domain-containing protein n=1 Tax=uncultured Erythrobacter sp. TaxID=263913 RepID=UPI0026248319|nr:DUF58 domain-containing protein [uncultured Erythrobacter sp.]